MNTPYFPPLHNYLQSIPAKPYEERRTALQFLYSNMKSCIADPLTLDEQWYDVHDDLSETVNNNLGTYDSHVVVGTRKLVYVDFLPQFITLHEQFLGLVQQLAPTVQKTTLERSETMHKIADTYKTYIEGVRALPQLKELDSNDFLRCVPEELGLRAVIKGGLYRYDRYLECFHYPRCYGTPCMPTKNYSAALGDHIRLVQHCKITKLKKLDFLPDDAPYSIETYPGTLCSYPARIRFVKETLQKIDLVTFREERIQQLLHSSIERT